MQRDHLGGSSEERRQIARLDGEAGGAFVRQSGVRRPGRGSRTEPEAPGTGVRHGRSRPGRRSCRTAFRIGSRVPAPPRRSRVRVLSRQYSATGARDGGLRRGDDDAAVPGPSGGSQRTDPAVWLMTRRRGARSSMAGVGGRVPHPVSAASASCQSAPYSPLGQRPGVQAEDHRRPVRAGPPPVRGAASGGKCASGMAHRIVVMGFHG